MNTPPAIGRLQTPGASLIYQTIGYKTIGATGPSTMPFIFQHGMGGDANQPLGYIGEAPPTPVISLNARGHSPSTDINAAAASFEVFADDVIALADQRPYRHHRGNRRRGGCRGRPRCPQHLHHRRRHSRYPTRQSHQTRRP
jgi:hypothetical protein